MPKLHSARTFSYSPIDVLRHLSKQIRAIALWMSETRSAARGARVYWSMTDTELQARGLKREDIVRLVLAGVI